MLRFLHLSALALVVMGCGMSRESWALLSRADAEHNERSMAAATAAFEQRGYKLVPFDHAAGTANRDACREVFEGAVDDSPIAIQVSALRAGAPPEVVEARAPRTRACRFLMHDVDADALDVVRSDGTTGRILRQPRDGSAARTSTGELVIVRWEAKVVPSRDVLVKMSCDHMPSVPPMPYELISPVLVVWVDPGVGYRGTVTIPYEAHETKMTCTENTY
jgi:hypothetical protein